MAVITAVLGVTIFNQYSVGGDQRPSELCEG